MQSNPTPLSTSVPAPHPGQLFAVFSTQWNPDIVQPLRLAAIATLQAQGVASDDILDVQVPGAWELPLAIQALNAQRPLAAAIALGCVIRGETRHYEQVADECARGLMRVSLDQQLPVANGVLAVERLADAQARAGGAHGNKGEEAALAALHMASLLTRITEMA